MRTIARVAGSAASAIDYHFGSLEQLYVCAQDKAIEQARAWCEDRLGQAAPLVGQDLTARTRTAIIAGIIDDWAQTQRPLAMAAREASAAARRGDNRAHRSWNELWLGFWAQMAVLLGMTDAGDLLAMFHDGEGTQHLLQWNRTLDLALLEENVAALLAFIEHGEFEPAPIRQAYRHLADGMHGGLTVNPANEPEPHAASLDRAAALILQEQGIAALTFRNVAAEAGETLGRTSWHFGSKTGLLKRAFEQLYRDASGVAPPEGSVSPSLMLYVVIEMLTGGTHPILRAYDQIILHIARSGAHVSLRGAIRAYRDPAANWVMQVLLAREQPVPQSLGAVFSSLCRGLDHYRLACSTAELALAEQMASRVFGRFLRL